MSIICEVTGVHSSFIIKKLSVPVANFLTCQYESDFLNTKVVENIFR